MSELYSNNGLRKLYFAAPLFSLSEKEFNRKLRFKLRSSFDVYLPQEDGGLVGELLDSGLDVDSAFRKIFELDVAAVHSCDVLLIILDGRSVDEGAAFELGLAYALGKECVGLQTDVRRLLPSGNNPMISCPLEEVFTSIEELVAWGKSEALRSRKFKLLQNSGL